MKHPLLLTKVVYRVQCLWKAQLPSNLLLLFSLMLWYVVAFLSRDALTRSSMRVTQYSHSQTKKIELVMACHALVEAVGQSLVANEY